MVTKICNSLLIIVILLLTSTVSAAISTSVDRSSIRVNETFELTLHLDSAPTTRPPLEGLPEQFVVIRSSNFYQRSTVNGATEIQAGWRFTLKALEQGIFTLPKFEVDGQLTDAMLIKVSPAVNSTSISGKQDAIRLTATVEHDEVYVQQQILFTIRLFRAVQAQYASLTEPEMEAAILERLGNDRQYETEIAGVRYIVLERRYVIFPQQKGKQKISPIVFSAEVSESTRTYSPFGRLNSRTKTISLSTEAIEINVKGRPQGIIDWWLPANNITLSEQWLPEPTEFRVGEPVTWSYTIKAQGLTATQLPELLPEKTAGLKFYPDTAISENTSDQSGIIGSRTQKVAVVPTKSGLLTLPALKLSWWDVTQNKIMALTLPTRTIEVFPAEQATSGSTEKTPITDSKLQIPTSVADVTENDNDIDPWKIVAIISLLLWIISALILALKNKPAATKVIKQNKDETPSSTSLADIKRACAKNSARESKDTLLAWCSSQSGLESVHSLAELARRVGDGPLAQQLTHLERALYSDSDKTWQGQALMALLNDLKAIDLEATISSKNNSLPPLHLSGD